MPVPSLKDSLFLYSMHVCPASIVGNDGSGSDLAKRAFAKENSDKLICLIQVFGSKFILEVFGGMGATWGSSEVLGLRVASNLWFWRPCALLVGVVFLLRWVNQVKEYIAEENIQIIFPMKSSPVNNGEGEQKPLLASAYLPDWLRVNKN